MKLGTYIMLFLAISFTGIVQADYIYVPSFAVGDDLYKIDTVTYGEDCNQISGWASEGACLDPNGFVWVANTGDATVTKIQASDCAFINTYPAGNQPIGVCVDMEQNIWDGNGSNHTVMKRQWSDGALLGTFNANGKWPTGAAADRQGHVWFVSHFDDVVLKFDLDGTLADEYPFAYSLHEGIAVDADGNVWVSGHNGSTGLAVKLNGVTGAVIYETPFSGVARSVTVDGAGFAWYPCQTSDLLHKVQVSDGALIDSFAIGTTPFGCAVDHDGYIWITCNNGSVRKFDPGTGSLLGTGYASTMTISIGDMTGFAWDTFVDPGAAPTGTPAETPTATATATPAEVPTMKTPGILTLLIVLGFLILFYRKQHPVKSA